jgi:hypothetical protein
VQQRLAYVIPILAIAILGALLYAAYYPRSEPVAMNIQTALLIQIVYADSQTQNFVSRSIIPPADVGTPGGIMRTQRYLLDGIGGYYPLSTRAGDSIIHVESSVVRNYTLADFFEVWGNPIGPNQTLNLKTNYTSTGTRDFYWDMCLVPPGQVPGQGPEALSDQWGAHVLVDHETVHLVYSRIGCGGF